jgi:hypothetical protein
VSDADARSGRARASQPIAPVLLHLGADVDEEIEPAFERWCEGHLADNLRLPGFVSARRLRRLGPAPASGEPPSSLTLYQLEATSALESPEYLGRTVGMPTQFAGRIRSGRSLYREIGADPGVRSQAIGPAILHVTVDVEPAWRERFEDWYVNVHVAAVLGAPGMLGVRRFVNVAIAAEGTRAPGQHDYCTLYEMEDAGVLARPETIAAASRGPCPPDLAPQRVALNHVYEEIFRSGRTGPG